MLVMCEGICSMHSLSVGDGCCRVWRVLLVLVWCLARSVERLLLFWASARPIRLGVLG